METALLFVHLIAALGLVGLVLMQRSEGGALGLGGGGGGLMTGRGAADVLARATTVLAAVFFLTSLSLTLLAQTHRKQKSVIETAPVTAPVKPAAPAPAPPVRAAPLENYTPPVEGGVVVPAPGQGAERAAPLPLATGTPTPAAAPPALRPATPASPEAGKPAAAAAPAPAKPTPAAAKPAAAKPPVAESVQTAPSAPAQTQPRTRAGPDE